MDREKKMLRYILFDFMKELPPDIELEKLSMKQLYDIIDEFINEHGLNDED